MEDGISEIEKDEIRNILGRGTVPSIVSMIKDNFEKLDRLVLNIAITGESGSGKSTFVNAFRGLGDDDEGAAPTGVVETTVVSTPYPHPKYRNVTLWDLPGIGTTSYEADEYLKKVEFQRYDFFIIIASERFRANDVRLANEIQRTGKKFYFVRSKIDIDIDAAERRRGFNLRNTLTLIERDCVTGLQRKRVESPKVFLISGHYLHCYDFSKLEETMERDLPEHKRRVLLLSIRNLTRDINQRKKEALKADIWKIALLSTAASVVPIPGASLLVDVLLLVKELTRYVEAFSLDDTSLQSLSNKMKVPLEELKSELKSPLHEGITIDAVVELQKKFTGRGRTIAALWLRAIPGLNAVINIFLWSTTREMLMACLDELAADAQDVLERAFPIVKKTNQRALLVEKL